LNDNKNYYKYYRIIVKRTSSSLITFYAFESYKYEIPRIAPVNNLALPLTSYEKGKIVNIECDQYQNLDGSYKTVFEKPYININNLGAKKINGTINSGQKYTLTYNGSSWDLGQQIIEGSYTGDSTVDNSRKISYSSKPKFIILEGYKADGTSGTKMIMGIVTEKKFYGWQASTSNGLSTSASYGTPTMFDTYFIPNYNAKDSYGGYNNADFNYKYILIY
jgi:hypothetical protein